MKRKLILHGKLKALWPQDIILDGDTIEELISGMCRVTGRVFYPTPGQGKHEIRVQGFETVESIRAPLGDDVVELHLAPVMRGGKKGGLVQIAIGVVLIVAAIMMPAAGVTLFAAGELGASAIVLSASTVFFAGVSMLASGLLAMLSPAPQMDMPNYQTGGGDNQEASRYLGAPRNTAKIGTRIPIIYGRHMHGGHVLSMNIDAKDVAV